MARIFLSHSSANDIEAVALRDWLVGEGWDDLFLDLDSERGIAPGERWERALNDAANRCEAVLFLVSRSWLASRWCLRELTLAVKLNKRIFAILIEDIPKSDLPHEIAGTWQFVDLAGGTDHQMFRVRLPSGEEAHVTFSKVGLLRLKTGLTKAGLNARFFAWPPENDPDRPPYRGLRPLEAEDAGIFFGREAPTIEVLDRLRGLGEAAPPRVFVILGASGAGKSSFLRAGLLPRLQRDDQNFLPLPIVRPERAAISGETGLVLCLETALKNARLMYSRAEIKAGVASGAPTVRPLLDELAAKARVPALSGEALAPPPRLILPVDQGEELFLAEGAAEAREFLGLVNQLASDAASNLIVLLTIRSDSFERFQTEPALDGVVVRTYSLPPLPRGAYQTVIEGPFDRLRETSRALRIEPALTAALLADVENGGGKDALPLLSFTLERLYLEYAGDGDLRLAEYNEIGGISGSIEAAVEHALKSADSDPAVPRDRTARLALLRRALIPWLAGIDPETGAPRRRVARLSEIPEEARPIVGHLIAARLLATDVSPQTGEQTIEPAHEALMRQWGLLQGWLAEDFGALSVLEGVKRAAREWEANARHADWLAHKAGRLEDAEALRRRPELAGFLSDTQGYLDACRASETARRDKELEDTRRRVRLQRRFAAAATVAAMVFAGIAIFAGLQYRQAERAKNAEIAASRTAERNLAFALDATDNLAIEIVRELETNFDIPIQDKIFVADRLDANFSELIRRVGETDDLRTRHAELLTSTAFMLFNVGADDLAAERVARATAMLSAGASGQSVDTAAALVRSRNAIAAARTQLYDMAFKSAKATLDEAERYLGQVSPPRNADVEADITIVRVQLLAARAQLLAAELHWSDASRTAAAAAAAARQGIETVEGNAAERPLMQRALYTALFQMLGLQARMDSVIGTGEGQLALAQLERDLSRSKKMFRDGTDPAWKFHGAVALAAKANMLNRNGDAVAALDLATQSIDQLRDLLLRDYGNLAWRNALADALLERSHLAQGRNDYRQADADLLAARTLAVSLKRDSANAYMVSTLDTLIDNVKGRQLLQQGKTDEALRAFAGLQARIDHYRTIFVEPNRLNDYTVFAQLGMFNGYVEKKRYPEALASARKALAALDRTEEIIGTGQFTTSRRLYVCASVLSIGDRKAIETEWPDWYRICLQAVGRLTEWAPEKSYWWRQRAMVLGVEASRVAGDRRSTQAIALYGQAVDSQLTAAAADPSDLQAVKWVAYYARERMKLLVESGEWAALLTACEQVRRAVVRNVSSEAEADELAATWSPYVQAFEAALSKADVEAVPSLDALRRELRLATAFRDSLDHHKSATASERDRARKPTLDPRSLDLSAFRANTDGDVLAVKAPLGFASHPAYRGNWQTLVGADLDDAIQLFAGKGPFARPYSEKDIERVRVARLPFYDDGRLYEAEYTGSRGTILTVPILAIRDQTFVLLGTSPPIHEANRVAPLALKDASDVAAYLRFFGAYLASDAVAFQIVESAQDLYWSSNAKGDLMRSVGRVVRPLVVWKDAERPGWWQATASLQFRDSLFHARLTVRPNGNVEMLDDQPVASNLPVAPPYFTAAGRVDRLVHVIDFSAFGESPVTNEIETLYRLASASAPNSTSSRAPLAAEATAMQLAVLSDEKFKTAIGALHRAIDVNVAAGNGETAYRVQEEVTGRWTRMLAGVDPADPRRRASIVEFAREKAILARLALVNRDPARALALAEESVTAVPDDAYAQVQRAHAQVALGKPADAVSIYRVASGREIEGRAWRDIAMRELAELEASGLYVPAIAAFRDMLGGPPGRPLQVASAASGFADIRKRPDSTQRYPSFSQDFDVDAVISDEQKARNLFGRVDFLMGKNDTIVIVVPASLPEDGLELYVDWYTLTFVADGRILAHIGHVGGEPYRRLTAAKRVGLVVTSIDKSGNFKMPDKITAVADVRRGLPDGLR